MTAAVCRTGSLALRYFDNRSARDLYRGFVGKHQSHDSSSPNLYSFDGERLEFSTGLSDSHHGRWWKRIAHLVRVKNGEQT